MPDDIADPERGMSEYWTELALVYLAERARQRPATAATRGAPIPEPSAEELDDKGRWFLAG